MNMNRKPQVSIVTVGMNHLRFLDDYLKSLYSECRPSIDFELIYVDNCSTDGSVEFIQQHYPQVEIIRNETIRGFSENNNIGARQSRGEYILILNPDIILLPNAIDNLYNYYKTDSSIGILVPKLLNLDSSVQNSVRTFFNLKTMFYRFLYYGRDDLSSAVIQRYLLRNFNKEKTQEVDWALGAAMFFDRNWFNQLKGFDEGYFLYVEDVDICFRSWKLGKPVVYLPNSTFIHAHQKISRRGWNRSKLIHIKSAIRFLFKHRIAFKSNLEFNNAISPFPVLNQA